MRENLLGMGDSDDEEGYKARCHVMHLLWYQFGTREVEGKT